MYNWIKCLYVCMFFFLEICICIVLGDFYYRIYDGFMIYFMGVCKYILIKVKNSWFNIFNVEVKNEYYGWNKWVFYIRFVDVKLGKIIICFYKRYYVYVSWLY